MSLELNRIYSGDCLQVMPLIENNSIDLIVCDLPYSITQCKWDKSIIPFPDLWKEYKRIIKKNGVICLTASGKFLYQLAMSNLDWYKYEYVWIKENVTGHLNCKKQPLRKNEFVLIFYEGGTCTYNPQLTPGEAYTSKRNLSNERPSQVYGKYKTGQTIVNINSGFRYPTTVLTFPRDKEKLHSTQKPVALFEYLIKTYSNENETVLDNTAGVGTTALAAINTNRNFICIELDEKYYSLANERIKTKFN